LSERILLSNFCNKNEEKINVYRQYWLRLRETMQIEGNPEAKPLISFN
jgi:hypothetical protein